MASRKNVPPPAPLGLDAALWLRRGPDLLGGADRIALLEAIQATGSMLQAAKAVGISYKTAWDRVQDMNNVAGQPLVDRVAGGAGGGGTRLTGDGLALIAAFRQIEAEHGRMLQRLSQSMADPAQALRTLSRLSLKTSARNQLVGTVSALRRGALGAEVVLELPGGHDRVVAALTATSADELQLAPGSEAVALIKAPSVSVVSGQDAPARPPRNCLPATVTRLRRAPGQAELQAQLRGGQTVVAMLGLDSLRRLAPAEGQPVNLAFRESSVILGV